MKPEKLADFEEKINVIRALIQGETVNYRDTEIKSAWADRRIPIIMACSGPKSLKLGAKIADGILYQVAESFNGDAIFVCGIGSGQENRGFEQAVGQLIDGVFYGRCCLSRLSYPDIAQVEILRGPQRAVIGKNTTAGAINIRTVQPTGEFEAWVTPTYELEGAKGFNIGEPLWVQTHKLLTT